MIGKMLDIPGLDLYHMHDVPIHIGGPAYVSALRQYYPQPRGWIGGIGGVVATNMFRPVEPCGFVTRGEIVLNNVTAQGQFAGTIYSMPLLDTDENSNV